MGGNIGKHMKEAPKEPLLILIGGAAGTGKSCLAKDLCYKMDIAHRMGSGFIREFSKSFVSQNENPFLYNYSFRPHIESVGPFENLYRQSQVLKDGIELCLQRAYQEGTSIVIEGVNIIPGLIDYDELSLFVVLTIEDYETHNSRILGKTHFKRRIKEEDFQRVRLVQEGFVNAAKANNYPIIDMGFEKDPVEKIKQLLHEKGL